MLSVGLPLFFLISNKMKLDCFVSLKNCALSAPFQSLSYHSWSVVKHIEMSLVKGMESSLITTCVGNYSPKQQTQYACECGQNELQQGIQMRCSHLHCVIIFITSSINSPNSIKFSFWSGFQPQSLTNPAQQSFSYFPRARSQETNKTKKPFEVLAAEFLGVRGCS